MIIFQIIGRQLPDGGQRLSDEAFSRLQVLFDLENDLENDLDNDL